MYDPDILYGCPNVYVSEMMSRALCPTTCCWRLAQWDALALLHTPMHPNYMVYSHGRNSGVRLTKATSPSVPCESVLHAGKHALTEHPSALEYCVLIWYLMEAVVITSTNKEMLYSLLRAEDTSLPLSQCTGVEDLFRKTVWRNQ